MIGEDATPADLRVLSSKDQLAEHFRAGIKAPQDRRVGSEHEKFIVDADTLEPPPYDGERGIGRILEELARRYDYNRELDGGRVIALNRHGIFGTEAISIEPGGQLELGGATMVHIRDAEQELDRHLDEVRSVIAPMNLIAIGAGLDGLHSLDDVPWMPKSRYGIMRDYMVQVGRLGRHMMKMTATVQANFDFTSEDDAADILTTALRVSPIVTALFANSPLWEGAPSGFMTTRAHVWTDTDPRRTGTPAFAVEGGFGIDDYVDFTLDVPMYFIQRDGRYVDMTGRSFRDFIERGFDGYVATTADYALHLSTIFTEVRMKRYIEVRGADMGSRAQVLALPALWKGLLYDAEARRDARELTAHLSLEERRQLATNGARFALEGAVPGTAGPSQTRVRDLAADLVRYAKEGLERLERAPSSAAGTMAEPDEARYLEPLEHALAEGSPATRSLARWRALDGDTRAWYAEQALP